MSSIIAATNFSDLNFFGPDQILIQNGIGDSEKGKDMQNEVAFIVVKMVVPVVERSISSTVQKEASAFLYVCQI